jgi:hypothetical protein
MEFHFRFGFQGETSNLHGMDVEQGMVILGSRRHSDTGEIRDGSNFDRIQMNSTREAKLEHTIIQK